MSGVQLNRVYFLARLAEALLHAGQPDAGLTVLAEALAFIHTSGERWWEAECHRLWGECLLAQQEPKHEAREGAARFQHALDIARHQHARSLELCAAMSLSRLWQQQGKREEAMRDSSSAIIERSKSPEFFSILSQIMAPQKVLNKIRHDYEIAELPMLILDMLF